VLQVEDAGPAIAVDAIPLLFAPGHEQREEMCCLELAACHSIARRLGGSLKAQPRVGGGLIISATVPQAE
jgi:C4-dicarboxylate-specific signal transduction histidine kinase